MAGLSQADHAEVNPKAALPLVSALTCSLTAEASDLFLTEGSRLQAIYQASKAREIYNCSYGLNTHYVEPLVKAGLRFSGQDADGEVRAMELTGHPFFFATLYQPERSALNEQTHPLITAFVQAAFAATGRHGYVYHLTPASELKQGLTRQAYAPQRLPLDGFVHCTANPQSTLAVANDYFANLNEPLIILKIKNISLTAPVKYEAPAPIAGGGRAHLKTETTFPHIYGPVNLAAIESVAPLSINEQGYGWPPAFTTLAGYLA